MERCIPRPFRTLVLSSALLCAPLAAPAQVPTMAQMPEAVAKDPPRDNEHPAQMHVVHIPTHGVEINGLIYVPAGAGPHPVVILFHGLPGNEQNLDLAQALRRAGWNVLTLHFRGSWGSPGTYSYQHQLEDAQAAVDFVRDARRALVLISATDDAGEAVAVSSDPRKWRAWIHDSFDEMESLVGCTPDSLANELRAHARAWSFAAAAPRLTHTPILMITADDGFRAEGEAFAQAIVAAGGSAPTHVHMQADHPYSDHRIALQEAVVYWLQGYRDG